ncbi:MAG: hypothetical protein K0Q56_1690 [Sporolactobacillus laevolacticus]|jgi:hypothetical protein|nr:hypothetical protein [Sporolactobacillus laevolacticus]
MKAAPLSHTKPKLESSGVFYCGEKNGNPRNGVAGADSGVYDT